MTTSLTYRERVRLALAHQQTDRAPISLICSGINPPARAALETYLRRERGIGVDEYLQPLVDLRPVSLPYIGPTLPAGTDYFGVHRTPVQSGVEVYEEIDHYPLAGVRDPGDLDHLRWPELAWFDYAAVPAQIAAVRAEGDFAIWAYCSANPFESAWYMRGLEQTFMDMIENPELYHTIMTRITDFFVARLRRLLETVPGQLDLCFTADDIAGQNGLLTSHAMWEEFIKPYHVRLNQVIHEFGLPVIYHSDGAVTAAVPGLLDMGIDVLQALQFDADGMDPAFLKDTYGEKLCFAGGISVQSTLPFGTPEQVRAEVHDRLRVLGSHGGYLIGPSHAIQGDTPPENIVAMFDAIVGE